MFDEERLSLITSLLDQAQKIVVLTADTSVDTLAVAASLVRHLEVADKNVIWTGSQPLPVTVAEWLDQPAYQTELANDHLHIVFPYRPEQVDSVSYHINQDSQEFVLIVQPQKGKRPLPNEEVSFRYAGASADLIVAVGVKTLESLGELYEENAELFENTQIISLANFEPSFAEVKVTFSEYSSLSEGFVKWSDQLGWSLTDQMATWLLAAVEEKTNHLQSLTATADTFEVVSQLMRAGGRRARAGAAVFATNGLASPGAAATNPFAAALQRRPVTLDLTAEAPDASADADLNSEGETEGEVVGQATDFDDSLVSDAEHAPEDSPSESASSTPAKKSSKKSSSKKKKKPEMPKDFVPSVSRA